MSDHHHCPVLYECRDHPRWKVTKGQTVWWADAPGRTTSTTFPTHAEAITHAQREGTRRPPHSQVERSHQK